MADVQIIDPSRICREVLGRLLEVQGYSTQRLAPYEAEAALRQSPSKLIILDPGLPGSKGWSILDELARRRQGAASPAIVILTDQTGKHEVLRAAQAGVRDYMLKDNFSLAEFLSRVLRHLAPSEPNQQSASAVDVAKPSAPSAPPQTAAKPAAIAPPAARTNVRPVNVASTAETLNLGALALEMGLTVLTRKSTLERLESTPVKTLPGIVAQVISMVNSPRGSISDIAQVLRRDPVLTARVLRVANSAAFSSQRARVATVEDAVKHIGVSGVRNLIVNVGVFDTFATDSRDIVRVARVWQHCLGVAMLMEKLAPKDGSIPPGSAYLVGLCHDLADLVLRQHFGPEYAAIDALVQRSTCNPRKAMSVIFGLHYAELVSQLLGRLRLPPLITVPIEEFFERGERIPSNGSGTVSARSLRAANVYAHGLLLASGDEEVVLPLGREECVNTFGIANPSIVDEDAIRAEAIATAAALAGLTSSQTEDMCKPFIVQQPLQISYSRHGDFSKLDPLASFLRSAARDVQLVSTLDQVDPNQLEGANAFVVAGPQASSPAGWKQDMNQITRLTTGRSVPVLYLTGVLLAEPGTDGITTRKVPTTIKSLADFLSQAKTIADAANVEQAA